jgi:RNA polymerase sigma factor (sigma-70 family)
MWPFVVGRISRHLGGHSPAAEDAGQEVFFRLIRYRPFTRLTDPDEFRAYLSTMCRNVAHSYIRGLLRAPPTDSLEDIDAAALKAAADTNAAAAMEHQDLWSALRDGLGEQDRKLFRLMAAGHDIGEIARMTGSTYGSVAVRVWRLRQRLRKRMGSLEERGTGLSTP